MRRRSTSAMPPMRVRTATRRWRAVPRSVPRAPASGRDGCGRGPPGSERPRNYGLLMAVVVTGRDLTLEQVVAVARERAPVELAPDALERMRAARALVEAASARGDAVYGLSTGVGARRD